eukprot:jgi/Botrbrau1/2858/Bobra.0036s0005.3
MRAAGLKVENIHVVSMEDLLSEVGVDPTEARQQLRQVVKTVQDSTGRDDLWDALRTALLVWVANRWGYTKIARGDNATTLAVRALAGVCKGVGFGLPASLQAIDTRHGDKSPTIVRPLREIAGRDIATFSSMNGLDAWPSQPLPFWRHDGQSGASLNAVVDKFVADMQLRLPSTASTVMRVMDRLEAFPLNSAVGAQNGSANWSSLSLCPICSAPVLEGASDTMAGPDEHDPAVEEQEQEHVLLKRLCVSCSKFLVCHPTGDPATQDSHWGVARLARLLQALQIDPVG